jgi:hypothetical protein
MAEYTSHVPGSFSWVELATNDAKAGVALPAIAPSADYVLTTKVAKADKTRQDHDDRIFFAALGRVVRVLRALRG